MTNPKFFDIHSHIQLKEFDVDREEVLARMSELSVYTVTIGTDLKSSTDAVNLAGKNQNTFASIGVHPNDDIKNTFDEEIFSKLISNPKVVAVGECGLDYFRLTDNIVAEKARQKKEFEKHIQFALKYNKPLMLHIRDAYDDAIEILQSYKKEFGEKLRGNSHFFAGNVDIAKKLLEIGFSMSFTGVITFARNYDEVIKYLPIDSIMSETDAPFVAPVPFRGKRCEPVYVQEVVKKIAEIRGEDFEFVRVKMVENALKFFGL